MGPRAGRVAAVAAPTTPGASRTAEACAFCGKPRTAVRMLIAGDRAAICDACVDVCVDALIAEGVAPRYFSRWWRRLWQRARGTASPPTREGMP